MGTYLEALDRVFRQHARRPALRFASAIITYAALHDRVRRGAAGLRAIGIRPGDRVAICLADKESAIVANLSTLFAGGVALPVNHRYTRGELKYLLSDSGANVIIVDPDRRALVQSIRAESTQLGPVVVLSDTPDGSARTYRPPRVGPDDACLLVYSSGTTGWPKGVVHTQSTLAHGLAALGEAWRVSSDDVVLNVLPLFHVHGLVFALHLPLSFGATVRVAPSFEPHAAVAMIGESSIFMAVPTIYYRLLETAIFREAARHWSRARLFTCGSAPVRADVLPTLESILHRPVINRYGMTEALVIASLPLGGPWPHGSVGLPLKGMGLRVTGEGGILARAGEIGSIEIRGPSLFRRYWGRPDATAAAFHDGWFDTGDLGSVDARGFLTLVGRKNDLIITNGYNVYPPVVERVINACPGVRESAVLGVPDRLRGERVVATVVVDDRTTDEAFIRGFLDARLVDYQRPVEIRLVASLPRNAMGKVLRTDLAALFESERDTA